MSNEELIGGDTSGHGNPAANERLRVMIVDDHEVWRIGLKQALEADGRAVVVAEATDGASAVATAAETMPDVIVMDMIMPTVGGAAATRRITEQLTYAKILVVSVSGEREDVLEAITESEILRLVAKGYKYREIAEQRFIALKTVQNHVQNILGKLHMHTKYELIVYAIRHGLDRVADQPAPQVNPKED